MNLLRFQTQTTDDEEYGLEAVLIVSPGPDLQDLPALCLWAFLRHHPLTEPMLRSLTYRLCDEGKQLTLHLPPHPARGAEEYAAMAEQAQAVREKFTEAVTEGLPFLKALAALGYAEAKE